MVEGNAQRLRLMWRQTHCGRRGGPPHMPAHTEPSGGRETPSHAWRGVWGRNPA